MFMLLKSEEKEEAKWAARDARDEQLFQLESKRIQHQLDKFERENARFQTAQQDQQLQAASLRNQILRGGGDGMALPGGMVEPAPTTPFGGGAAPLARAPGGPASSGLAPPPGGELTPGQALAGSDMSTRPSIMGGVVGEDIQSVQHLIKIFEVCNSTPGTMHWLPTQERRYLPINWRHPKNLEKRLSNAKNNSKPGNAWSHWSTVVDSGGDCPASKQGNVCGSCRRCWSRDVKHVTYPKH